MSPQTKPTATALPAPRPLAFGAIDVLTSDSGSKRFSDILVSSVALAGLCMVAGVLLVAASFTLIFGVGHDG